MTSPARQNGRSRVIWYAALAVVVLAGIVAVVAARGSNNKVSDEVRSQQTAAVQIGPGDSLPASEAGAADEAVGRTIPTVSGTSLGGKPITIGPDGQAKVILFVAHWCPHCKKEIPLLVDHLETSPMPADVELLSVSTSVAEERGNYPPSAWLDREGWTAPVLADSVKGEAGSAFGLQFFPYFVVVDAEGKVVARASGELPVEEFDRLVKAAQTGQAPA